MLNNINMEFIQALNPMYAIPIVAVIFCAFIVYAFGFKSSVPPPSFDGIEEEKKYIKKKRTKENQKVNKVVQNGKMNGSSVKSSNTTSSKKSASEKAQAVEKPANVEKINATEKKVAQANKKNKAQNEKKTIQGKKIETVPQEDLNDDGWVQLLSKKGRKNRKKDEATSLEVQSTIETMSKDEPSKLNDVFLVDDSPKLNLQNETVVEQKQPSTVSTTKASKVKESSNAEKTKKQNVQFPKPDDHVEKQPMVEPTPKESKILEESNKSKKKKKKNLESNQNESESSRKITSTSESSVVKEKGDAVVPPSPPKENTISNLNVTEIPQSIGKVEVDQPSEVKSSNVAFDELAGLYPETKEQKKKKKVRRDH